MLTLAFVRLLAVIVLWFAALVLWNLGQFRAQTEFSAGGFVRFVVGAALMFVALFVLYESFPLTQQAFSYVAIGTFLAALAADFLIGDDIRALMRRR